MGSKFDRHINKGEEITLDGDVFVLKAAGSSKVVKPYFKLMKAFKGIKPGVSDDESTNSMLDNFTDETADAIQSLILETLKVSYPDEDVDKMEVFAMKHLMELMPVVMKIYAPEGKDVEKVKKIEEFNKLRAKVA